MAKRLSGKEVAASLNERTRSKITALADAGIIPTLQIIRAGENESDLSYERGAVNRCKTLGAACKTTVFPADVTEEALLAAINEANRNEAVHGVLLLRPLPPHLNEHRIANALIPEKDIDCMTDSSLAGVFTGKEIGYPPCTPKACMEILDYYGISCSGKKAVVIGRSTVVGRPVSMMLLKRNATVTVCHTKTPDLPSEAQKADILIVSAGKTHLVNRSYVRPGQIVIDVGIHAGSDKKLTGDVDFSSVEPIVEAITPVPGGVGSVTTSVLVSQLADAAEKKAGA